MRDEGAIKENKGVLPFRKKTTLIRLLFPYKYWLFPCVVAFLSRGCIDSEGNTLNVRK